MRQTLRLFRIVVFTNKSIKLQPESVLFWILRTINLGFPIDQYIIKL